VSKKDYQTREQKKFFPSYGALFNFVIKAMSLVLEKYLAEIQLPRNITQLLSIQTPEFRHGLLLEISITSYELQMLLQLSVACSWAFCAQTVGMASTFSFHHSAEYAPLHVSSS
jgi:hypothetical protein